MTNTTVKTISVEELHRCRTNHPNLCLIDVREPEEWQVVHIPGALHIPKDVLPLEISAQVPEKKQAIYLYCRGGVRSMMSAQALVDMGYQEVYSVEGGIVAWEQCGYPTTR